MKIRTFIALKVEDLALEKIISINNKLIQNSVLKCEPKEKLHITLKFIGDIDEYKIPQLIIDFESIANNYTPFILSFSNFGLFKNKGIPSILWAGIKENKTLLSLYFEIDSFLSNLGFAKESRTYKPHLTLVRFKKNFHKYVFKNGIEIDISQINFRVYGFSLFRSELKNTGSVYTEINNIVFN